VAKPEILIGGGLWQMQELVLGGRGVSYGPCVFVMVYSSTYVQLLLLGFSSPYVTGLASALRDLFQKTAFRISGMFFWSGSICYHAANSVKPPKGSQSVDPIHWPYLFLTLCPMDHLYVSSAAPVVQY